MKTALILPCAGEGTRLGLPYPKEIHSVDGKLLIDGSLEQARNAGIKEVFIVTTEAKRREIAKAIGVERFGLQLTYTLTRPHDSNSLPGTILRGCRAAIFRGVERFVVGLPDTWLADSLAMRKLLQHEPPCFGLFNEPADKFDAVYVKGEKVHAVRVKKPQNPLLGDFAGTWGLLSFNKETVLLLKRFISSTPPADSGDHHLLGELIDNTLEKLNWHYVNIPGKYWDLGTWDVINEYIASKSER